jgi:hypothetical protein
MKEVTFVLMIAEEVEQPVEPIMTINGQMTKENVRWEKQRN